MRLYEPRLRLGFKAPFMVTPREGKFAGVQRVAWQQQHPPLLVSEPLLNQREVAVLVVPVQFVTNDRVPDVRQVNPNLMFAPCPWPDLE